MVGTCWRYRQISWNLCAVNAAIQNCKNWPKGYRSEHKEGFPSQDDIVVFYGGPTLHLYGRYLYWKIIFSKFSMWEHIWLRLQKFCMNFKKGKREKLLWPWTDRQAKLFAMYVGHSVALRYPKNADVMCLVYLLRTIYFNLEIYHHLWEKARIFTAVSVKTLEMCILQPNLDGT